MVAFKVLGISKIHGDENKKFQNHLFISFYFTIIVSDDSDGFHLSNTLCSHSSKYLGTSSHLIFYTVILR